MELARQLPVVGDVVAYSRSELDICDHGAVRAVVDSVQPLVIVNAAAYTAVDRAEEDEAGAYAANAVAVENLARLADTRDAWLIHYSTDYVFDGTKGGYYLEGDVTNPLNVYGASKLEGERAIARSGCKNLVFRTSWVIGKDGHNFAKTILRLASGRDNLQVVADQLGVPTSPLLIGKVTADAISAIGANSPWDCGIYHLAPHGETTWHEIAQALVQIAGQAGVELSLGPDDISPVPTSGYPTPAVRPLNSRLDTAKLSRVLPFELPAWEDDFSQVVGGIIMDGGIK